MCFSKNMSFTFKCNMHFCDEHTVKSIFCGNRHYATNALLVLNPEHSFDCSYDSHPCKQKQKSIALNHGSGERDSLDSLCWFLPATKTASDDDRSHQDTNHNSSDGAPRQPRIYCTELCKTQAIISIIKHTHTLLHSIFVLFCFRVQVSICS